MHSDEPEYTEHIARNVFFFVKISEPIFKTPLPVTDGNTRTTDASLSHLQDAVAAPVKLSTLEQRVTLPKRAMSEGALNLTATERPSSDIWQLCSSGGSMAIVVGNCVGR
jgi:hypothetical protein